MKDSIEVIVSIVSVSVVIVTSLVALTWWLSRQFSDTRGKFYVAIETFKLSVKETMDKHEQKDESRFLSAEEKNESRYVSLAEQIKQIQIRNAAFDARYEHKSPEVINKRTSHQ